VLSQKWSFLRIAHRHYSSHRATLPLVARTRVGAYLSAAVDQMRAQGVPVEDANAARLGPLGHAHLNVLGRYAIASSAPAAGLRQLGEIPDVPDSDGDVDEAGV
jgi:Tn3 transposase DDE domain